VLAPTQPRRAHRPQGTRRAHRHQGALTRPTRRLRGLALTLALAAAALAGCAFVESVATIAVGAPDLPAVKERVTLTRADLDAALEREVTSFAATLGLAVDTRVALMQPYRDRLDADPTWLTVRGVLCEMTTSPLQGGPLLPAPSVEVGLDAASLGPNVSAATLRLEVPSRDVSECLGAPLTARLTITLAPMSAEALAELNAKLGVEMSDVIAAVDQIRLRLHLTRLFVQDVDGGERDAAEALASVCIEMVAPALADDPATPYHDGRLEVVPAFLFDTISPQAPQRFELDPDSPVTDLVTAGLLPLDAAAIAPTLQLVATATLRAESLGTLPLEGSGLEIWAQPEVVINGLEVGL
jgi:hypothetical protein